MERKNRSPLRTTLLRRDSKQRAQTIEKDKTMKKSKRYIVVNETDTGVLITMDKNYFNSLKYAISKAFKYGYADPIDGCEFHDLLDIEEEFCKIK